MNLFGPHKKAGDKSLRTLTEKEIQDKLYGTFRDAGEENLEQRQSPGSNKVSAEKIVNASARPAIIVSDSGESAEREKLPLWKTSSQEDSESHRSREDKKQVEREARLAEWADEEEQVQSAIEKKNFRPSSYSQNKTKQQPAISRPAQHWFLKAQSQFKTWASSLIGKFQSLNLERPRNQKPFYVMMAAIFLFSVLLAIHLLNARREGAMRTPAKSVTKPAETLVAIKASETEKRKKQLSSDLDSPVRTPAAGMGESGEAESVKSAESSNNPVTLTAKEAPYVIQIATFAFDADGERLKDKFQDQGLRSFVKTLKRADGKAYYSVFIGRFKTYSDAQAELANFKKKDLSRPFEDAFIRTLN